MGYNVSAASVQAIVDDPYCCDIVFDATTADAHKCAAPILRKLGKFVIDLTPSKVGKLCIPCLNGDECLNVDNVNMVTCGGQSIVPFANAVVKACGSAKYVESNSVIASLSAGTGTRANIDEYVHTTAAALRQFSGVSQTKSMIVLNPADPPIKMRNTLYVETDNPDIGKSAEAVASMEKVIQSYVPGFKVIVPPSLFADNIITVSTQVSGSCDFLPEYAGNLDIITCAAIEIAEKYAAKVMLQEGGCLL